MKLFRSVVLFASRRAQPGQAGSDSDPAAAAAAADQSAASFGIHLIVPTVFRLSIYPDVHSEQAASHLSSIICSVSRLQTIPSIVQRTNLNEAPPNTVLGERTFTSLMMTRLGERSGSRILKAHQVSSLCPDFVAENRESSAGKLEINPKCESSRDKSELRKHPRYRKRTKRIPRRFQGEGKRR